MGPGRLIVISDDPEMANVTAYVLRRRGWEIATGTNLPDALAAIEGGGVDLALIDIYKESGQELELCRQLRAKLVNPILVLTGHHDEHHIVDVYRAGADECIARPVSYPVLSAKIAAWLRRSWTVPAESLETLDAGAVRLDPSRRAVHRGEETLHRLTNLEFRLLHLLMTHRGHVLPPDFIIERVWRDSLPGDHALLKNVIYRLRRKVEPNPSHPRYIRTVSGQGYLFAVPRDEDLSLVA